MVLGLAAGQSEALCPLIVQESFFLHERGKYQMIFTAVGNILTTILTLLTSYIGTAIGSLRLVCPRCRLGRLDLRCELLLGPRD